MCRWLQRHTVFASPRNTSDRTRCMHYVCQSAAIVETKMLLRFSTAEGKDCPEDVLALTRSRNPRQEQQKRLHRKRKNSALVRQEQHRQLLSKGFPSSSSSGGSGTGKAARRTYWTPVFTDR